MAKKSVIAGIAIWAGSVITMDCLNAYRNRAVYLSEQNVYMSEQEFLDDLAAEKQRLGLDSVPVTWEEDGEVEGGHTVKVRDGYHMKFNPARKSRRILRHELYHVQAWEDFTFEDVLDAYLFGTYEEWNATSYSLQFEEGKSGNTSSREGN